MSILKELDLLSEASAEIKKDIEELEDEDVKVDFERIKGRFGHYFSSVSFDGKITKVDAAKKIFIVEYDHFSMNDETVAGGPGDKIRKYKTAFNFADIDSIDERGRNYFIITMKA